MATFASLGLSLTEKISGSRYSFLKLPAPSPLTCPWDVCQIQAGGTIFCPTGIPRCLQCPTVGRHSAPTVQEQTLQTFTLHQMAPSKETFAESPAPSPRLITTLLHFLHSLHKYFQKVDIGTQCQIRPWGRWVMTNSGKHSKVVLSNKLNSVTYNYWSFITSK